MANFNFPCRFLKAEDGTEIIKCRDLPEILSWSVDGQPLEAWARYAVEDCIAFRIKGGTLIPEASEPEEGEYVVELDIGKVAKVLLSNAMVEGKVSRADLSRASGLKLPEITRILNIYQATKIDRIDEALKSIGRKLQLSLI